MENNRFDMLEWLGPDASACVLTCLDDPADVARASSVSRSWHNFVISNELGKRLATQLYPEISNFTSVQLSPNPSNPLTSQPSSSNSTEQQILENQHRVYTYLSHAILNPRNSDNCVLHCIGASSTDNFPEESILNTLEPNDRVELRPSYWSSGGQIDENAPECLVYKLDADLYVLDEIRIKPFKAYFQYDHPIYSSKKVRFKMGYAKVNLPELDEDSLEDDGLSTGDDNYVWTHISPEYSMSQESTLQSFKLPRPVLCIGGILKVELLGRVQKQTIDGLFYICVCHVQVIGRPVSPQLSIDTSSTTNQITLHYFPGQSEPATSSPGESSSSLSSSSRWESFTHRIRNMGPNTILSTLFGGPVQFAQVEDYEDDDDVDGSDGYDDVYASEEEVEI
ncbi:hypothetical protein LUZ60_002447 [Juncus effusus]|nr:hypothetical protein LUZ60_002447 [Juncus effusus]